MNICIAGKNNIAVEICQYIISHFEFTNIYAIPNINDQGKDTFQRSFKKYCVDNNIELRELKDVYKIQDLIFLSLEFDRIIDPDKFISNQLYNIHFSLLPKYKGMYTAALPILNGEEYTGVTLHYIEKGIDTGNIIAQEKILISDEETSKSLYLKFINSGIKLIIKYLPLIIKNKIKSYPQCSNFSTYFSKKTIDYSHLTINLNSTAWQIDSQIRAFTFRNYQLPEVFNIPIFISEITSEKSCLKSGSIIEDNNFLFKLATIDYNIILYKDKLKEILECCKSNNIVNLIQFPKLSKYINEQDKEHGWTPLMVSTYYNSFDIVKYLIANGAKINLQDHSGLTALAYAVKSALLTGNLSTIDYIIEHGGDSLKKDYSNKTILDYLWKENRGLYEHILKLL